MCGHAWGVRRPSERYPRATLEARLGSTIGYKLSIHRHNSRFLGVHHVFRGRGHG
jgi:hypothetical protein